jgi:hypothetical protein
MRKWQRVETEEHDGGLTGGRREAGRGRKARGWEPFYRHGQLGRMGRLERVIACIVSTWHKVVECAHAQPGAARASSGSAAWTRHAIVHSARPS